MIDGKFKSRKSKKRASRSRRQFGQDGSTYRYAVKTDNFGNRVIGGKLVSDVPGTNSGLRRLHASQRHG